MPELPNERQGTRADGDNVEESINHDAVKRNLIKSLFGANSVEEAATRLKDDLWATLAIGTPGVPDEVKQDLIEILKKRHSN